MIQEWSAFFRKDQRNAVVEFCHRVAMGKRAFVGCEGGALPFADMDDAEWAAGKACGAEGGTSKRRQRRTQQMSHRIVPPQQSAEGMLSQVVSRESAYKGETKLSDNELGSSESEPDSPRSIYACAVARARSPTAAGTFNLRTRSAVT